MFFIYIWPLLFTIPTDVSIGCGIYITNLLYVTGSLLTIASIITVKVAECLRSGQVRTIFITVGVLEMTIPLQFLLYWVIQRDQATKWLFGIGILIAILFCISIIPMLHAPLEMHKYYNLLHNFTCFCIFVFIIIPSFIFVPEVSVILDI